MPDLARLARLERAQLAGEGVVDADLAHGGEASASSRRTAVRPRALGLDLAGEREQRALVVWAADQLGGERQAGGGEARRDRRRRLAGRVPRRGEGIDDATSRAACAARSGPPTPPARTGGRAVVGVSSTSWSSKSCVDPLGLAGLVAQRLAQCGRGGSPGPGGRTRASGAGGGAGRGTASASSWMPFRYRGMKTVPISL